MTNIDEFFTIFFDEIFVKGYDDFYLLTIASFRIGVPSILFNMNFILHISHIWFVRECVRNLDLRVQVHPGELWVSKQRVHIVLEASKSAGAKGDFPKICGFVHPL